METRAIVRVWLAEQMNLPSGYAASIWILNHSIANRVDLFSDLNVVSEEQNLIGLGLEDAAERYMGSVSHPRNHHPFVAGKHDPTKENYSTIGVGSPYTCIPILILKVILHLALMISFPTFLKTLLCSIEGSERIPIQRTD
jgi:hypothetical protein